MPDDDQYPLEDTPYFTYLKRRKRYRVGDRASYYYNHPMRLNGITIAVEHVEEPYDTRGDLDATSFAVSGSGSFSTSYSLSRVFANKTPTFLPQNATEDSFYLMHTPYVPWRMFGAEKEFSVREGVGTWEYKTYRRSANPEGPGWLPWVVDEDESGTYDVRCKFVINEDAYGPPIGSDPTHQAKISIQLSFDDLIFGLTDSFYRKPWENSWEGETLTREQQHLFTTGTTSAAFTFT